MLLGLGVLGLVSMVFGMMAAVSQDLPAIYNFAQYKASKNSEVFDSSGEPIGTLTSDQNKILLTSGQISPNIKNAVVSIEDSRFYEHNGVDFQGIGRALVRDVLSQSAQQGASTITEQFVKNALEAEGSRTVFEKFREAALAYRLERHWSKDKILTEYLNTIYFGEGAYGIEAAARTYFGRAHPGCGTPTEPCASVLEPWEAATLAGDHRLALGLRPQGLSRKRARPAQPGAGKDVRAGLHHRRAVRRRAPSRRCPRPTTSSRRTLDSKAPYFTAWLRQQLVERYGASKAFFGGLKVKSTLDLRLQGAAEEAVNSYLGYSPATASVVVIDNHNAGVKAMVGGPNFETKPFNLATQGHRQPGSSIKPFTLITALEEGISPYTTFESAPQDIPLRQARPGNLRRQQRRGLLPRLLRHRLRDDLLRQLDLRPARPRRAEGQDDPGPHPLDRGNDPQDGLRRPDLDQPGDGARRARSSASRRWAGPTPTRRSATTATGSAARWRRDPGDSPVAYTQVTDQDGHTIKGGDNDSIHTQVIPEGVAEEAKSILETVVSSGTGTHAHIGASGQWGKTGTTENNGDAWFCGGVDDEVTACVWVGYADTTTPMTTLYNGGPVMGGTFPALIWASVISAWEEIKAERAAEAQGTASASNGDELRRRRGSTYVRAGIHGRNVEPAPEEREPSRTGARRSRRRSRSARTPPNRAGSRRPPNRRRRRAAAASPPASRPRARDVAGCRRRRSARGARPLW